MLTLVGKRIHHILLMKKRIIYQWRVYKSGQIIIISLTYSHSTASGGWKCMNFVSKIVPVELFRDSSRESVITHTDAPYTQGYMEVQSAQVQPVPLEELITDCQ